MITVKLWGGLGNQLFQYAYGYQLAKKSNSQISLDLSWFVTQRLRAPEILKLNIEYEETVSTWENNRIIAFMNKPLINRIIRVPRYFSMKTASTVYLKETRFHYSNRLDQFCKSEAYLDGYWQCPKYFSQVRPDLMKMFSPQSLREEVLLAGEKLKLQNTVAIHVRHGDYPKKKPLFGRLWTIDDDYYRRAVEYMEKVNPSCSYYLFSDDPSSAKLIISSVLNRDIFTTGIAGLSSLEEWYLMGCCRHQIIGNSTFSWWASYLNDNPDKIVCAPDGKMGNDDIIPENWIKFHC